MSTEELPADLDKLKITSKHTHIKLRDRNPFYSLNNSPSGGPGQSADPSRNANTKQIMFSRRIRRRSESNIDDFHNKKLDPEVSADTFETLNPLRCLNGVHKQQLKRNSLTASKRNLLREPILRILTDNAHTKTAFVARTRRSDPLNIDEKSRTNIHKARNNPNSRSSINGICSFRDLISECNSLLDESKSNTWQSSKNFTIWQKDTPEAIRETLSANDGDGPPVDWKERDRERPVVTSGATLSCSQEASSIASNPRNCDDVTIVELASYFDTMVHIPKKMSSMAEMMYI
ncbi:uncharacterized protein LOC108607477 [Drosophila busckii]|uniref:uncharacterized protein LOC108607477 n=1 Tax=Drosophila busckii TaxID=30019 RepID=UPI00083EE830|nr:uncharacterized protein LOC108607477 [Drosophila busckii]